MLYFMLIYLIRKPEAFTYCHFKSLFRSLECKLFANGNISLPTNNFNF